MQKNELSIQIAEGIELLVLKNFELSKIDKTFAIADFERDVKRNHVAEIAQAIMEARMYDPLITVVLVKGKYEIIDGQHRITALKMLYEQGDLKRYTIIVKVLVGMDARQAYRSLNSGKPLTVDDVLKSYDDGKIPFFNELRDFCVFYPTHTSKIPYSLVIRAYGYATNKELNHRERVIRATLHLKDRELEKTRRCMLMIQAAINIDPRKPAFKVLLFWNLVRIYWRWYEDKEEFTDRYVAFVKRVADNKDLAILAKQGRSRPLLQEVLQFMEKIWKDPGQTSVKGPTKRCPICLKPSQLGACDDMEEDHCSECCTRLKHRVE